MALLEVRGLRTGYEGIPVVFGIDLDVDQGEVVALLGANGAGKTTTLRAISSMIPAMAGSVHFAGERITGWPAERVARAGLLHVPAGRGIFPTLTVADTLRLAAALAKLSKADEAQRLDDVYATFPRLKERVAQTAGTLSGGEQQMLALARALITRPRLLMVDEMSQGLAPTIVADLFEVLERFTAQGTAVLLVEQFVGQALAQASRAYVLEKGEVSYAGSAAQLAADEDFVKGSYLGDVETAAPVAANGDGAANGHPALAESFTVSLPPVLVRSLQQRAEREGIALTELIRQAVEGTLVAPDGAVVADDTVPPRRERPLRAKAGGPSRSTRKSVPGGRRGGS
jgi:branched-chain amino acid transport system ATP-binding protein